jgi:hemoglobin-like flavoprotein
MNSLVKTIHSSLNRTVVGKHFFDIFYEVFINSHPDIAPLFVKAYMESQKAMLHHGLMQSLAYLDGKSTGGMTMERIRYSHGPDAMNIPLELYDYWKKSLLQVVEETDPHYYAEIAEAWKEFSQTVVDLISGKKDLDT